MQNLLSGVPFRQTLSATFGAENWPCLT